MDSEDKSTSRRPSWAAKHNPRKQLGSHSLVYTNVLDRVATTKGTKYKIASGIENLTLLIQQTRLLVAAPHPARYATQACVEAFGASFCFVQRVEPASQAGLLAYFPQEHPPPADLLNRWEFLPIGSGPTGLALGQAKTVVINNVANDPNTKSWCQLVLGHVYHSLAAFPLIGKHGPFGVLVTCQDTGPFMGEWLDMLELYTAQIALLIENERLRDDAEHRQQRMVSMSRIHLAITASADLRVTMAVFLDEALHQLEADAGNILLLNTHLQVLELSAARGFRLPGPIHETWQIDEGFAKRIITGKKMLIIERLRKEVPASLQDYFAEEGLVSYVGLPLIIRGRIAGVLELFMRTPFTPDKEWLSLAELLAGQAAMAIDNATLLSDMQRAHSDLVSAYDATIAGWSRALELRDRETEGHSQRVTTLTMKLARSLGFSDEELVHVRRGTLLHDIGKMAVPDAILQKKGPLTPEEQEIMQKHPIYAQQWLAPIKYLRSALDIPMYHHERWDGTGYPFQLKGEAIPLSARIFAVIDVWDALTSDRPYSKAWSKQRALDYIRSMSGSHFDPQVVEAFLEMEAKLYPGFSSMN